MTHHDPRAGVPAGGDRPWQTLAWAARDLLLAETCAACDGPQPRHGLCQHCRRHIAPAVAGVHPLAPPPGFPPTWAAGEYHGVLRRAVVAHKEQGRLGLAIPLGNLLAAAVRAATAESSPDPGPTLLVPIPSRRGVTRTRGHDPVRRLAAVVARLLRAQRAVRVSPLLAHRRAVADQSGLDLAQRHRNLHGAFRVRSGSAVHQPPMTGASVVLLDDVCSSGATLAAALTALVDSGWRPGDITAAVLAAPPVRGASLRGSAEPRSGPWPGTGP